MKKRIVSISLAFIMVVAMIPAVLVNTLAGYPTLDAQADNVYSKNLSVAEKWNAGINYSSSLTPINSVSDDAAMYSVYTTTHHVELDGKMDEIYLNSTMARPQYFYNDSSYGFNTKVNWYAYPVATLDGLYVFAHVDDATMNNISNTSAGDGDSFEIYLDWTPYGFAHNDGISQTSGEAYRDDAFADQVGFIDADYDGNFFANIDFAYANDEGRVAVNKIKNPNWNGFDPNTQYKGYDLEIFIPYTDYMRTVVATHSENYHFSMGFMVSDDEKYDSEDNRTSVSFDTDKGSDYYVGYETLPDAKFNYAKDLPFGAGSFYAHNISNAIAFDGQNTNGEYDDAQVIYVNKAGNGEVRDGNIARVICDGNYLGVLMEISDDTVNANDRVDFFCGRPDDNYTFTLGNYQTLTRGFGTMDDWVKSAETDGGWTIEARFMLSDGEKAMYREGKLIYGLGFMYADIDSDGTVQNNKYSLEELENCYDKEETGICNAELLHKIIVSPDMNTEPMLVGANVALGENLSMNYYARLGLNDTDAKLRVTMNEEVTYLGAQATVTKGEYKFSLRGIAPKCMGDIIKAELIVDGEVVAIKDNYSVLKNVTRAGVMKTSNEQLIYDLLAYGAASQNYTYYKTDSLVNEGYEDLATIVSDIENEDRSVGDPLDDGRFTAAGIYHADTNKVYAKFETDDIANTTVTVNGKSANIKYSDGEYIVYSNAIKVIDFDEVYTFVLVTASGDTQILTYSVNAYCKAKLDSEKEETAALARAMYAYGVSAEAYVAN